MPASPAERFTHHSDSAMPDLSDPEESPAILEPMPSGPRPAAGLRVNDPLEFESMVIDTMVIPEKTHSSRGNGQGSHSTANRSTTRPFANAGLRRTFGVNKRYRDRFIPARPTSPISMKIHQMCQPPKMSAAEKLLRQRSESPDPFAPFSRRTTQAQRAPNGRLPSARVAPAALGFRATRRQTRDRRPTAGGVWEIGRLGPPEHFFRGQPELNFHGQPGRATVWSLRMPPDDEVEVADRVTGAGVGPLPGIPNGRGGLTSSGSNAPMYVARFLDDISTDHQRERFEGRLLAALDLDHLGNVLKISEPSPAELDRLRAQETAYSLLDGPELGLRHRPTDSHPPHTLPRPVTIFHNNRWVTVGNNEYVRRHHAARQRNLVPTTPFRVLDAPGLRDDFYCSLMAYSPTCHALAVALGHTVYLWSEKRGASTALTPFSRRGFHVTALDFSSAAGRHSILATGMANGRLVLWSIFDNQPRFELEHYSPIACLAWKPRPTKRLTKEPGGMVLVPTEELLVGDELGHIGYYSVEWPRRGRWQPGVWFGAMTLLCRIDVHTQQICGLAWSADGQLFATGANDNACCLFETRTVMAASRRPVHSGSGRLVLNEWRDSSGRRGVRLSSRRDAPQPLGTSAVKYRWMHSAAVKAIAFCPWQAGLVATGGGSNDRCIHFFNTDRGGTIATINVAAQVTSLIWATTRREIAVTFGYAQPEHPYRIAVFAWPECTQLVAIPWANDMRALYGIRYPGVPDSERLNRSEGGVWSPATAEEGCIIVAGSDRSLKFHEVWSRPKAGLGGVSGLLGGSPILESLHGIERPSADVIR
ncbi:MAG: hypothetical protein M1826_001793 [Phylliscum demangeonii]|nr:MAG: hypothetical protein M1826_001793 [Phylliscum demangeonii]